MAWLHTITLEQPHSFDAALAKLDAGMCIGIRPGDNASFVVRFKPKWQREDMTRRFLCWHSDRGDDPNGQIAVDQFLGNWFLVVVDHRDMPLNDSGMVTLKKTV